MHCRATRSARLPTGATSEEVAEAILEEAPETCARKQRVLSSPSRMSAARWGVSWGRTTAGAEPEFSRALTREQVAATAPAEPRMEASNFAEHLWIQLSHLYKE